MSVSILENLTVEAYKAPWVLRLKLFRECRLLVNNFNLKLGFNGSHALSVLFTDLTLW